MQIKIKETGEIKELDYTCHYDGVYNGVDDLEKVIDKSYLGNDWWEFEKDDENLDIYHMYLSSYIEWAKWLKDLEESSKKAYKYSRDLSAESKEVLDLLIETEILCEWAKVPQIILDMVEKHKKMQGKFVILVTPGRFTNKDFESEVLFETKKDAKNEVPKNNIDYVYEIVQA